MRFFTRFLLISSMALPAFAVGIDDPLSVGRLTPPRPTPQGLGRQVDVPCATSLPASLSVPLTAVAAVDLALCNHPQTREVWASARAQAALLGAARGAWLPTLGGSLSSTGTDYGKNKDSASVTLSWLLFDFGQRSANVENAVQLLAAAAATQDATVQSLFLAALQAYYSGQATRAAVISALEAERSADEAYKAAETRYQVGVATPADRLQAKTALSQARLNRIKAEGDARNALGTLANALGLPANVAIQLAAMPAVPDEVAIRHAETQDHGLERALDHELIGAAKPAITRKEKQELDFPIRNLNRSVGAMLSGDIAKRYGAAGLPEDTLTIRLHGTAGQSFGAFLAKGVNFVLEGEGNDYVGKGLSGGRIVVRPPAAFRGETQDNIIVGNTVLYGATDGEAYFSGVGGERFAVRNSGATAVVEGVGDHGCEYMTGGTVVVLGQTGRNFGAGMSGGFAYVYDVDGKFASRCNMAQVALEPLPAEKAAALASEFGEDTEYGAVDLRHLTMTDEELLKELIAKHVKWSGSQYAKNILDHWDQHRAKFIKVIPHEYRRALADIKKNAQKEAV